MEKKKYQFSVPVTSKIDRTSFHYFFFHSNTRQRWKFIVKIVAEEILLNYWYEIYSNLHTFLLTSFKLKKPYI